MRGEVGRSGILLARLRLIGEMQADGHNLNTIKRLLDGTPGAAEQVLGFKQAITAPFDTEEPEVLTAEDLTARFGLDVDPKALEKAEKLRLLVPLGEGRYEAPTPSLLSAAEEVMGRGVSLAAALQVMEQMKRHSEGLSRSFVKLFLDEVWKPFVEAGHPEEGWPEILETIESLRPLASNALLAVSQNTMTREVDSAFGEHFARGKREQ